MSRISPWLSVAFALFAVSASHAAPIAYDYSGVITSADPSTGVVPGTRFSGMFTYDPAHTPYGKSDGPGFLAYYYGHSDVGVTPTDGSGITLQVGDKTVQENPGGVQVLLSQRQNTGDAASDRESPPTTNQDIWGTAGGAPSGPYTRYSVSTENYGHSPVVYLEMTNSTRAVFPTLAPPTAVNLADFTKAQLLVYGDRNPGGKLIYTGTIDTLTAVSTAPAPAVPEPASALVFGVVAGGLFAHSRRRRTRPT